MAVTKKMRTELLFHPGTSNLNTAIDRLDFAADVLADISSFIDENSGWSDVMSGSLGDETKEQLGEAIGNIAFVSTQLRLQRRKKGWKVA